MKIIEVAVADLGFVKGGFTNVNVRKFPYQVYTGVGEWNDPRSEMTRGSLCPSVQ